ncbi:MAPEG family protein [Cognatishimia sp. SS12]|uniref:MAPEG family protein n=1 Tax=Cognatishimia sp. SS12 TaxID=2979465 RepID=UPI00233032F3|nr:MAPEG family protein [Cognatishimia sp. SS12]MDC0739060.1 MAPEG family protein [Cognatishimia sp. SS12]
MTGELTVLALSGLLIILVIFFETGLSIAQLGDAYMRSPRDEKREKTGMAGRSERAVLNCAIGLALFAPAILILAVTDGFTGTTLAAAWVYLITRVIYVICYVMGIPTIRTLAFVTGLLSTGLLYLLAL